MKVPLVVLTVLVLYLYPYKIREFIDRAGFRVVDMDVFGVRLAEKAAADLEGTAQKLAQVTAALAERDRLLNEIASSGADDAIRAKARAMLEGGEAITASALAVSDRATIQAAEIGASLQTPAAATAAATAAAPAVVAATVAPIGRYLVIFGADLDLDSALHEIERVRRVMPEDGGRFGLFRKGSFYRSAAAFDSPAARDRATDAIAAAAGRAVEPVALERWCPSVAPAAAEDSPVPVFQC
jgi:hypothetical protein